MCSDKNRGKTQNQSKENSDLSINDCKIKNYNNLPFLNYHILYESDPIPKS